MQAEKLLTEGTAILREAGIADYNTDVFRLLEHSTGITRAWYYAHKNEEIQEADAAFFRDCISKRSSRIPLQQITGTQEFMGLPFIVNASVLIPRGDTECLVEEILRGLEPGASILELGTGSGCIIISLLVFAIKKYGADCKIHGTAVDISAAAIETAIKNRDRSKVPDSMITFIQGDFFSPVAGRFDIIVSNPPYISCDELASLEPEVRDHEPFIALCGGKDGLECYKRIIADAPRFLKNGGRLFFEIGSEQGEAVALLMQEAGFQDIHVVKDLAGLDRIAMGRKQEDI